MSYDENDAAQDAFYERMYEEFHRDHADEIADEITTGEVLAVVLGAHREWWPLTQAALEKAHKRLDEAEHEEAVFHAGRAFDGYIRNVLATPLIAALVERFQRSMPAGFPIKGGDLFKSVSGLGNSVSFAEYALSLVIKDTDDTERVIRDLRALVSGDRSLWRTQRDRTVHAPVDVGPSAAATLLERVEAILSSIVPEMMRRLAEEDTERERREFSPLRVEMLHALAVVYDGDPDTLVTADRLRLRYAVSTWEDRSEVLGAFVAQGYVERLEVESADFPFMRGEGLYRLTPGGRSYYETEIQRRLPAHLRPAESATP